MYSCAGIVCLHIEIVGGRTKLSRRQFHDYDATAEYKYGIYWRSVY